MTDRQPLPDMERSADVALRAAVARVPTSVSVITAVDGRGDAWGVTVGTLCSLSLTPPLVSFCLDRQNASHDVLTGTTRFLVHVLRDQQVDVARRFARRGGHDLESDKVTAHGLPSIPDPLIRLACRRNALIPSGDHTIVIGLVEDVEVHAGRPLLYYERGYYAVSDSTPEPAAPLSLTSRQPVTRLRERPDRRIGHERA